MNSDTVPIASSPCPMDNAEVLSQGAPSRGETVPEAPQGDLPDSRSKGSKASRGSKFGPQPNTAPEPPMVPDSGRRPPSKRGKSPVPVTSSASIDEEHRTHNSAVIKKVRSAKSGLTEACASLLTGFEVSI